MTIRQLKFVKDCGLLTSTEKIYVPPLNASVEIWVDTDCAEQLRPTEKQITAFENFLNMKSYEFLKLVDELENYRKLLVQQGRTVHKTTPVHNYQNLEFKQILLPKQSHTKDLFLFIFADTEWKIRYKDYTIELEILYTNNNLELAQEMTGLWTRVEWNSDYNVIDRSPDKRGDMNI